MRLSKLVSMVGRVSRKDERDLDPKPSCIEIDSRSIREGALFVALEGEHADGHDYVEAAIDAGASAVLVDADRLGEFDVDVPILVADDTRGVLGRLAAAFHGRPSEAMQVVGITGTNGKTTTSHILASILRAAGSDVGVIGTIGHRWDGVSEKGPNTTPESLRIQQLLDRMRRDGVDTVVMEVSSHGLATHRLTGTAFDVALFTNLSQDHLDFHGDIEAYRRAKASLFRHHLPAAAEIGKSPVAILNVDDATGALLAEEVDEMATVDTQTVSTEDRSADLFVRVVDADLGGTQLEFDHAGERAQVTSPLMGAFNVENCSCAAGVALSMGVSLSDVTEGIASMETVPGRLEPVDGPERTPHVFVDYAHTPDALRRALETLSPLTPGRLIVIFGCGGDRDRDKRPIMGEAATSVADLSVVTSDNPRSENPEAIIEEILDGIAEDPEGNWRTFRAAESGLWVESDRAKAIEAVVDRARTDDVVLVAGKGHEQYQEIGGEKRPFDDVEVAHAALLDR